MKKRLRAIKAKPGELKLAWSKLRHEKPDICFAWGDGCSKRDGNFLAFHFTAKICQPDYYGESKLPWVLEPSFVDQLKSRGYDITTIKFSIQKLACHQGCECAMAKATGVRCYPQCEPIPPSTPKPPGQSEEAV